MSHPHKKIAWIHVQVIKSQYISHKYWYMINGSINWISIQLTGILFIYYQFKYNYVVMAGKFQTLLLCMFLITFHGIVTCIATSFISPRSYCDMISNCSAIDLDFPFSLWHQPSLCISNSVFIINQVPEELFIYMYHLWNHSYILRFIFWSHCLCSFLNIFLLSCIWYNIHFFRKAWLYSYNTSSKCDW